MKHFKNFIQTRGPWAFGTIWQFTVLFNLLCIFTGTPAPALTPIDVNNMTLQVQSENSQTSVPPILFFILGDSLAHGTMDATNNETNTLNAYVQLVADALECEIPLYFQQPFFDDDENRIEPFVVPTNLGVDGGDIFSLIGLEYYKRAGEEKSAFSRNLLADRFFPSRLKDKYDKVLYPINLLARKSVSQLSGGVEHIAYHFLDIMGFKRHLLRTFSLGHGLQFAEHLLNLLITFFNQAPKTDFEGDKILAF